MSEVAFHKPSTLREALDLLANEDTLPVGGGVSLVAMMNAQLLTPAALVSLRGIVELEGIRVARRRRHRRSAR